MRPTTLRRIWSWAGRDFLEPFPKRGTAFAGWWSGVASALQGSKFWCRHRQSRRDQSRFQTSWKENIVLLLDIKLSSWIKRSTLSKEPWLELILNILENKINLGFTITIINHYSWEHDCLKIRVEIHQGKTLLWLGSEFEWFSFRATIQNLTSKNVRNSNVYCIWMVGILNPLYM